MESSSRVAILKEILSLEEKAAALAEELRALYRRLDYIRPQSNEAEAGFHVERFELSNISVPENSGTHLLSRSIAKYERQSNKERILQILADGRPRTTFEIQEEMGQSTLNTTQSEVSKMVNKTRELAREGDRVRIRRKADE